ncbi:MAG: ribonuclease D [Rhodospirillales bacterium]|nr:ribonuclease D [Rhodospirillales bacterium]MBO6787853.1 ribonuclease D [Rhodospirillales bacterium]
MSRQVFNSPEEVHVHRGDIPAGIDFGNAVAVDTETQGLNLQRDRLCVVQLSAGDGVCHLVQMPADDYSAPNLKALMTDPAVTKIFHFARFDVAIMKRWLGITISPVFCTKIASKLVRTYTDKHGLKDVTRELVGIDLSKAQQSSDWAADELSDAQIAYAASDVLNLHSIRDALNEMLEREGRTQMAQACFDFLPARADLDLAGWSETDIFAHS